MNEFQTKKEIALNMNNLYFLLPATSFQTAIQIRTRGNIFFNKKHQEKKEYFKI